MQQFSIKSLLLLWLILLVSVNPTMAMAERHCTAVSTSFSGQSTVLDHTHTGLVATEMTGNAILISTGVGAGGVALKEVLLNQGAKQAASMPRNDLNCCSWSFSVDRALEWLHFCATMRTATVRDLRNHYTSVLRWVSAGEDVLITQRGVVIAKLSPATPQTAHDVDWASSPEVLRDRSRDHVLSAGQSAEILAEAGGKW